MILCNVRHTQSVRGPHAALVPGLDHAALTISQFAKNNSKAIKKV